jgi:trigger factor
MDARLEQLDDRRVRLTVPVPAGEVRHAVSHAAHDLAERVKVPGFRAGKVPPEVLVSRIGKERLYSEAVESHISSWFWSAARVSRLRPSQNPAFSYELPATDDQDWVFTAEFPVQGPVDPVDWRTLEVPRAEVTVDEELVGAGLEALQATVASLSGVEGRSARPGDVAVVDILSDSGPGQRDYVVELGSERLLDEIEAGIHDLLPGESQQVSWSLGEGATRQGTVRLKELYEKVLPPLDDDFARSASEFETLTALRDDIETRIRELLEEDADNRFRAAAVDELVKATKVEPAQLVVEVRTRELLNAFLRQLESRGIDPVAYLRMAGISGEDLERTMWAQAIQSIARELVLEGAADKLGIEVTDEEIRSELREEGESDEEIEEFLGTRLADRIRDDLRLRRAAERIAAEVTPITKELADVRERIWTPDKESAGAPEKKLWTPGSTDEGAPR